MLSPSSVKVPDTDWTEPVIIWLTMSMHTGSGKSTLFRHLYTLMREVHAMCGDTNEDPSWIFDDASFEKMGALMHENTSQLQGFYDELSAFLTQINLYRGHGLSDSHELALFLQLYNGHSWRHDTGQAYICLIIMQYETVVCDVCGVWHVHTLIYMYMQTYNLVAYTCCERACGKI